jgi:peptidyl-dipeptidase Dcp
MARIGLEDISIRNELRPGDLGYLIYLHGSLYARERGYGLGFETYVAKSLVEFMERHDPDMDRVWVCEHEGRMIGFLLAMDRGGVAQLRYFLIEPEYRGIGLGTKLIRLFLEFIKERGYRGAYLWTTDDLDTAIGLYTRAGFALAEEKKADDFGQTLTERRYELELPVPGRGKD